MADWYGVRRLHRSAKAVIAIALFAVALVAAVPLAFVVGVFMMLFGHVVGGLAVFGGAVLLAVAAVALAALSGVRHVRHLRDMMVGRDFRVLRLTGDDVTHFG
jgi:uncharacterized membrane protein YdjX (TVP38/TMEM64 family)